MGACSSGLKARGAPSVPTTIARAELVENATGAEFVTQVKEDGRLLADYALHLKERGRKSELVDLWALDLALSGTWDKFRSALDACKQLAERLGTSWDEYKESPEGLGNFDDNAEWARHDFPGEVIVRQIAEHDKRKRIGQDDEMYGFSIAAMVGVHVAIVCSSLLTEFVTEVVGSGEAAEAAFRERFPMLDLLDCQQKCIRTFPVPPGGSAYSPHTCLDEEFEIEEMAPTLFAEVRKLTGVATMDFFESVCRTDFEFISFGTNSKSGEFFFFSHDEKYLLKTTTEIEAKTLVEMLPKYINRLREEPKTMLGRYLGLYRLHYDGVDRLFFIMRAVSDHKHEISRIYDLKGSVHNRTAKPGEHIGKDNNFWQEMGESLDIPSDVAAEVARVHRADVALLKEFRIMDFSLLLQIHDRTGKFFEGKIDADIRILTRAKTQGQSVKLRSEGLPGVGTWLKQGGPDPSAEARPPSPARSHVAAAAWLPSNGTITRADGSLLYTFGLIDMLVPFNAYPKMQYVGGELISCGKGRETSRVPPDFYCSRQAANVHKFCSVPLIEDATDRI